MGYLQCNYQIARMSGKYLNSQREGLDARLKTFFFSIKIVYSVATRTQLFIKDIGLQLTILLYKAKRH